MAIKTHERTKQIPSSSNALTSSPLDTHLFLMQTSPCGKITRRPLYWPCKTDNICMHYLTYILFLVFEPHPCACIYTLKYIDFSSLYYITLFCFVLSGWFRSMSLLSFLKFADCIKLHSVSTFHPPYLLCTTCHVCPFFHYISTLLHLPHSNWKYKPLSIPLDIKAGEPLLSHI